MSGKIDGTLREKIDYGSEAVDEMAIEYEGETIEQAFNGLHFSEMLKYINQKYSKQNIG